MFCFALCFFFFFGGGGAFLNQLYNFRETKFLERINKTNCIFSLSQNPKGPVEYL